jgi:hypothetical protein
MLGQALVDQPFAGCGDDRCVVKNLGDNVFTQPVRRSGDRVSGPTVADEHDLRESLPDDLIGEVVNRILQSVISRTSSTSESPGRVTVTA